MHKIRLNSVIFRIVSIILILSIFISWLYIASLNWNVPDWIRTVWVADRRIMESLIIELNIMSISYILINFVPSFALLLASVIIFFIITTKKGKIKYLEQILMKVIFYGIILTSVLFMIVSNIPYRTVIEPIYPLHYGFISNIEIIRLYSNCLTVIGVVLIGISIIGLYFIGKLNLKREIENLTLKV